jgi:hypothetical protein
MRRNRSWRRFGRGGLAVAAVLCATTVVWGCGTGVNTLGPGEQTQTFKFMVTVTNVGTGFGRATVAFPAGGTVQNPCTAVLAPGQSCRPSVTRNVPTVTADVNVSAQPGSRFMGWVGANCTGTDSECTVRSESNDPDIEIGVEARFDLITGGVP